MSRLRENPEKLFEVFLEVGKPTNEKQDPYILQKYPLDYQDEEVLKSVPKFAFPCDTERYTTTVDHFTFTLTDLDSKFKYGFCRHATGAQTSFCIVSFLPWFEVFYNFLNVLAEITNRSEDNDVESMLRAAFVQEVPPPNVPVTVVAKQEMFSFKAPDVNKLASIPTSRNLTEYYNAVDIGNMMIVFASMLHERRIVITSKKLSRLTAVVHAAASLLYPMYWQHLFIPVLPAFLIDYLSAPMPFVIGVHTNLLEKVRENELGDAVIINADKNTVSTEYDDLEDLPDDISSYLKRHLKGEKVKNSMQGSGDIISKTFMMSLVKLIGGYRDALKFVEGETITFHPEIFIQSRHITMQPFLENMLQLQIFQQFINERLDMLNDGRGFADLFEQECMLHADKLNAQTRYNEWLHKMKKQGKKLHRGGKDVWSDLKDKTSVPYFYWKRKTAGPVMKEAKGVMGVMTHRAGPAMTNAVESVKIQGKKAYSKARTKINDLKKDDQDGTPKQNKSVRLGSKSKSFSKEKPFGISKDRPSTIVGAPLQTQRPPRPPASQLSDDTPRRPQLIVRQPSSERTSRFYTHTDSVIRTSADDSDFMYNRVSCNLMSDPDIQNAMFKSASAENLPKSDPLLQSSDSSGTITSDSSMDPDIDHDSHTLKHKDSSMLSYTALLDDNDSGIVMRTSSQMSLDKSRLEFNTGTKTEAVSTTVNNMTTTNSNFNPNLPPPRPAPRNSISPSVGGIEDKLIKGNNVSRERPHPAPRKLSMERNEAEHADLLINLDTPAADKSDVDFVLQFDKMNPAGDYVTLSEKKETPERIDSSNNRRSSVSRTPAMKLSQNETPKRPSIRRERSPISPDEPPQTVKGSVFDFDPLFDQSKTLSVQQKTVMQSHSQSRVDDSESLLKDWDITGLTSAANTSTPPSQPFRQTGYANYPTPSPRQSLNMNNSNLYSPRPAYVSRSSPAVPQVALNFQNPLAQTSTPSPQIAPRSKNKPNSEQFSSPQTGSWQTHSSGNKEQVNQSDPFADLVNLNKSPKQTTSPQPPKQSWQTFD